jgi:hypothetical protein
MRNVKGKIHLNERWGRCIGKGERKIKGCRGRQKAWRFVW